MTGVHERGRSVVGRSTCHLTATQQVVAVSILRVIVTSTCLKLSKYVLGRNVSLLQERFSCKDALHVGKIKQK